MKRKIEVPESIDSQRIVTLKSMGNIREIGISDRHNSAATIRPISREEYILLSTGEVKKVKHHAEDRTGNLRNLEKCMNALADLINANIFPENVHCCRFITLTYRENMKEAERLYHDFSNFNKRLRRHMEKQGHHYEYIVTVEAQARGAFHLHGIFIFSKKAPFIESAVLSDMWGLGFVSVKAVDKNIDDIGRYLTAYLTDLPVDDGKEILPEVVGGDIKEIEEDGSAKHIIKGARLKLLPPGIRIYRYSKGIKKPVIEKMPYCEAMNRIVKDGYTKVNEYAVEIIDTDRDFKTKYIKQTFKKHINTALMSEQRKEKSVCETEKE